MAIWPASISQMGQRELAERLYRQSLEAFVEIGDSQGIGKSLLGLASLMAESGDLDGALQHYRESLALEMKRVDSRAIIVSLEVLSGSASGKDVGRRQKRSMLTFWMLFALLGDSLSEASVLCSLGNLRADLGRWDNALECYQDSLSILEKLGDIYAIAVARNNLGNICYRRGDWTAAQENYSSSIEGFEKAGDVQSQASGIQQFGQHQLQREGRMGPGFGELSREPGSF